MPTKMELRIMQGSVRPEDLRMLGNMLRAGHFSMGVAISTIGQCADRLEELENTIRTMRKQTQRAVDQLLTSPLGRRRKKS